MTSDITIALVNGKHHRTEIGERFSEGARRLWLALESRGWSFRDLAGRLSKASDVPRWLYGDKRPPLWAILEIEQLLGIDPALWLKLPTSGFVVPALRRAS